VPKAAGGPLSFRMKLGIYLLFLSVYLASSAGHFSSTDQVAVYLTAQSLVERHGLAIKPINDTLKGKDGQYYARYQPAQSVLSIPLYLVGTAIDRLSSPPLRRYWSGSNLGDWGGTVPIFFVALFDQLVTPLTCLLVFLFCLRLGFPAATSFLTTLVFGFATGTWVYAREYFQHPLETLLLLTSIYVLFVHRQRLTPRHALLAGIALAGSVLTRINVALVTPIVLLYVLSLVPDARARTVAKGPSTIDRSSGGPPRLMWAGLRTMSVGEALGGPGRYALAFVGPVLVAVAILLWLNELRFGNYLDFGPNAYDRGFSTPVALGLYGYLLSPGRSIFLYSPPIVLALFAFGTFYRRYRAEALLFAGIVVVYLLVYSTFGYWAGGWSFGPRYLLSILPFMTIPVAYFFSGRPKTSIVAVLALLGIGIQILGVTVNYSYVYWDWTNMNLSPPDAFLFVPDVSAIPTHLKDLLQGRNVDLWLVWVYQQFGTGVFLLTVSVPLLILASSLALLRDLPKAGWRSERWRNKGARA
jgi:hypothetical protein